MTQNKTKKTYFNLGLYTAIIFGFSLVSCLNSSKNEVEEQNISARWSIEKANEWSDKNEWLRGANFNPSTAINQLETWQAESFDPVTIDRELGYAEGIGLNCMRVYLHHLAWEVDKDGFKSRIDQYLTIANKHQIKTIFVFFDDCWNATYAAGKQPDPKPGIHNSGWVQDPGELFYKDYRNINLKLLVDLEEYVKDILNTFSDDERIVLWDLYNEPGNTGHGNASMTLLKDVFRWAREVNPSQPISAGIWLDELTDLNKFQIENSDIITYHNYNDEVHHQHAIDSLSKYNRPMVCTEYMARQRNSRFENIMPILKNNKIGAINWGLVTGKSNTMYMWDAPMPDGSEPDIWFHDIFRPDGSAFDDNEIAVIKGLTE